MALLKKKTLIDIYNSRQSKLLSEGGERRYAANTLNRYFSEFSVTDRYDIFISHSYDDARIIKQIRDMLTEMGYSVYVDWIEDESLDRGKVTELTATLLRNRMNCCSSLIYITSESAEKSVWMPWELGYMDARTGRVAVAPILDEDVDFDGREYLGLYPYLDLTNDSFYLHRNPTSWVVFSEWMKGNDPKQHR